MGLLSEIQNDAISGKSNVAALLRKCLLLAARVDSGLLEDWVKFELKGYPNDVEVPDYRDLELAFKGNFSGPFGAEMRNAPIPPNLIEQIIGDNRVNRFTARQPITTISDTEKARNAGVLRINFDDLALITHPHDMNIKFGHALVKIGAQRINRTGYIEKLCWCRVAGTINGGRCALQ